MKKIRVYEQERLSWTYSSNNYPERGKEIVSPKGLRVIIVEAIRRLDGSTDITVEAPRERKGNQYKTINS